MKDVSKMSIEELRRFLRGTGWRFEMIVPAKEIGEAADDLKARKNRADDGPAAGIEGGGNEARCDDGGN